MLSLSYTLIGRESVSSIVYVLELHIVSPKLGSQNGSFLWKDIPFLILKTQSEHRLSYFYLTEAATVYICMTINIYNFSVVQKNDIFGMFNAIDVLRLVQYNNLLTKNIYMLQFGFFFNCFG